MFFTGGPCTIGPGQIIGLKLDENLRSYYDLNKENDMAKHVKKTTKYY